MSRKTMKYIKYGALAYLAYTAYRAYKTPVVVTDSSGNPSTDTFAQSFVYYLKAPTAGV